LQRLFAPWRYEYVSRADNSGECIFCAAAAGAEGTLGLVSEGDVFALLNLYPYTSGHAMVAPVAHVAELAELPPATLAGMLRLATRVMAALRSVYAPHAFNLGMNLGETAGAGIPEHLHLHVVPRWRGDTNFMSVTAGVRVIPEDLATTRSKLRAALAGDGSA
jgi:ATP adenylyltransferase